MPMKQRNPPTFFAKEVTAARRFYRNLAGVSGGSLRVVAGGVEQCGSAYCVDRESFPFTTIEYVARGRGELGIAGKHHSLGSGSVFVYEKHVPHRITSAAHGRLVKYFAAFVGAGAARLLRASGLKVGQIALVSPADSLTPLFEELVWAGTRAEPGCDAYCRKILECLAVRIHASLTDFTDRQPASFRTYQDCRDRIEHQFLTLRSAQDIAGLCGISEVYLCHLFQRYDHQTPHRLLTRLKMTHAAALLQQSDILVREAADVVGYPDQFHFSRTFRAVLGVPPSEWRRMNSAAKAR